VANAGLTGTVAGCTVIHSGAGSPITYHIYLPQGKFVYTLTGAAEEDGNASGDLDITANVHIIGQEAGGSIIDGGGIDRVFHICPGGGCDNSVTFTDVTIRNGDVVGNGGGIYNWDGTVMVDDSTITNNKADVGGGICNMDTLNVQNGSTVSDNEATGFTSGGGIYNYGTLTVTGSTVIDNMADNAWGGGIHNSGTTTVDGSTVTDNTAQAGGGICNTGTLDVQNGSTIGRAGAPNTADSYGGGIYNSSGTTAVDGSTVSANTTANYGGGIYNEGGTLTVQNGSTIGGASAPNTANQGGGIYNYGTLTVTGSRILYNTATYSGGGVFSHEDLPGATTMTGSCIMGNSDTSFFNDEAAIQIATGNWWGAASGPSGVGPGAGDSVNANVDYGGFLTKPILGCGHVVYLPLVVKD
jgi:hypothetical protein